MSGLLSTACKKQGSGGGGGGAQQQSSRGIENKVGRDRQKVAG